jgi:hypothetical protein
VLSTGRFICGEGLGGEKDGAIGALSVATFSSCKGLEFASGRCGAWKSNVQERTETVDRSFKINVLYKTLHKGVNSSAGDNDVVG